MTGVGVGDNSSDNRQTSGAALSVLDLHYNGPRVWIAYSW